MDSHEKLIALCRLFSGPAIGSPTLGRAVWPPSYSRLESRVRRLRGGGNGHPLERPPMRVKTLCCCWFCAGAGANFGAGVGAVLIRGGAGRAACTDKQNPRIPRCFRSES